MGVCILLSDGHESPPRACYVSGVKLQEYEERIRLQDEKMDKQDELILQLTCKEDALKRLKNDDKDPDDSDIGGEPKKAPGSSTSAGKGGGEESSLPMIVYSDPTAASR